MENSSRINLAGSLALDVWASLEDIFIFMLTSLSSSLKLLFLHVFLTGQSF